MLRLSRVLREYRWAVKQDLRTAAREIGIHASTLSRLERGKAPDGATLIKVQNWLFQEMEDK